MDAAELQKILRAIPQQKYDSEQDFVVKVVSPLVRILGYPDHQTFYDAILPGTRHLRPDVLIAASRLKRPWLIIEAKITQQPFGIDKTAARMQLFRYCDASKSEHGMILHPKWICIIRRNKTGESPTYLEIGYDLDSLSEKESREILETLRNPNLLPEENLASRQEPTVDSTVPPKHKLDVHQLRSMLSATQQAVTNNEKKTTYESLARFILESLPFLRCKYTNLRTKSSEIDLIMEYRGWSEKTAFDWLGRYVLVECKNWASPVGAAEVRDFVGKMCQTGSSLGVVFARNGITGERDGADAVREIHNAWQSHKKAIVIISETDIDSLIAGASIYEVIDQKIDARIFDL